MMELEWDFFISYASENGSSVASPLADALRQRGYKVWLDTSVGINVATLEDTIQNGLLRTRYGLVLVSARFLEKDWTRREFETLLALEAMDATWRTLVLLLDISAENLKLSLPLAAHRTMLDFSTELNETCDRIERGVITLATRRDLPTDYDASRAIPRFGGTSTIRCTNLACTWTPYSEYDRAPELTFALRGGHWYVVCDTCGSQADGPYRASDARELAAMVRVSNLWAPEVQPKGGLQR